MCWRKPFIFSMPKSMFRRNNAHNPLLHCVKKNMNLFIFGFPIFDRKLHLPALGAKYSCVSTFIWAFPFAYHIQQPHHLELTVFLCIKKNWLFHSSAVFNLFFVGGFTNLVLAVLFLLNKNEIIDVVLTNTQMFCFFHFWFFARKVNTTNYSSRLSLYLILFFLFEIVLLEAPDYLNGNKGGGL